ncbi:nucleotidyltransferase family protein [Sporosarcina sp. G11-34]|uniref:nucleotidyltransferase family protein n=1 Tax=Sporosarcina sp. G11-34 TaxID=2849605 RepID=UPI0022A9EFD8|nr:nucleotidyltransferase family protein [Sporosarcina sp. G11-34]MCZ2258183.1 nucleotidyltransferase family protein [Sporosarcina sp. G11-34]
MNTSICALILAAGTSNRMGKPKQLLLLGNRTILEHVIHHSLEKDFSEVIAVIGHETEMIKKVISIDDKRFRWVENADYLSGQSASLRIGIESLREHHSNIMVFLGDLPFTSTETIRLIYQSGVARMKESEEAFMIRPTHKGVSGHPVFFGNIDRNLFAQLQGDKGGKTIMNKISDHILLDVDDHGILFDVDTPSDYVEAKRIQSLEH